MSTPTGDDGFRHELEITVEAELVEAESSQRDDETLPIEEWLVDPMETQRYEVGLRGLLGAIEAVQDARPDRPA
jgi:hypothetical protein